ncbi:MAG: putative RNA-binding Zn-ribbon protein involved in translation (DUF1610 family) [Bacteroidia bacterium]|jgi:predicted RNA-binding Zn-ribbon protein involved in translation (DUF1610 family)
MKTIRLATCNNLSEAHIMKAILNSEGIECFLTNQNFTTLLPIYNGMLGAGIQVMIDEQDLVIARSIIKETTHPDNTELACPKCGSTDIVIGLGNRKGLKVFNIFLAIISAMPFGNMRPKYECNSCNCELK